MMRRQGVGSPGLPDGCVAREVPLARWGWNVVEWCWISGRVPQLGFLFVASFGLESGCECGWFWDWG